MCNTPYVDEQYYSCATCSNTALCTAYRIHEVRILQVFLLIITEIKKTVIYKLKISQDVYL